MQVPVPQPSMQAVLLRLGSSVLERYHPRPGPLIQHPVMKNAFDLAELLQAIGCLAQANNAAAGRLHHSNQQDAVTALRMQQHLIMCSGYQILMLLVQVLYSRCVCLHMARCLKSWVS